MDIVNTYERIRLDKFLIMHFPHLSRKVASEIIRHGNIKVNGKKGVKGTILNPGDIVSINSDIPEANEVKPDPSVELNIIFIDSHLIAVNKPAGLHSHPISPHQSGTILNGAIAIFPEISRVNPKSLTRGLLHRLDKGTSGVLLFARDQETCDKCRWDWRAGRIHKEYLCLVKGLLEYETTIEGFLFHTGPKGRQMGFSLQKPENKKSWYSKSIIAPVKKYREHTLVRVRTSTGVTHQVRAHLSFLNLPIAGDNSYGNTSTFLELKGRFFLHASKIEIPKGEGEGTLSIEAPLPVELENILKKLSEP